MYFFAHIPTMSGLLSLTFGPRDTPWLITSFLVCVYPLLYYT
nr:MAG TPA: hypothetical protein [Caudoviricetes sp.]